MDSSASSLPQPHTPLPRSPEQKVLRMTNPLLFLLQRGRAGSTRARRLRSLLLVSLSVVIFRLCVLRSLLPRIARALVARSKFAFSSARIEDLAERELVMAVKGSITETGPFSVSIAATGGLEMLIKKTSQTPFRKAAISPSATGAAEGNGPISPLPPHHSWTATAASATDYRFPPALEVGDEPEVSPSVVTFGETSERLVEITDVETTISSAPAEPAKSLGPLDWLRRFWALQTGGATSDGAEIAELRKVGTVAMPDIHVRRKVPLTRLDMSTRVSVADPGAFGELAERMVTDRSFSLVLRGLVNLQLFGGLFTIPSVLMHKEVTMRGMSGLRSVAVQSITVNRGTPDHIELSSEVVIDNPSDISVDMGDTRLTVRFEHQIIGTVLLPGLFLRRGQNAVRSRVFFSPDRRNPPALAAARVLLSRFATGRTSTVNIRGDHPKATSVAYILPALRALNINCEIGGITEPLLRSAVLVLSPKHLFTALAGTAQSRIEIANPFGEFMTVLAIEGSVSLEGQVVGVIRADLSSNPLVVPAMSTQHSDNLPLTLRINSKAIRALLDAAGGQLFVDITSSLLAKVGEYKTRLDYDIENVPCSLSI